MNKKKTEFVEIKSPVVGRAYLHPDAPYSNKPACVKLGSHVNPKTTLCLVEAMMVFLEVKAGVCGKIVKRLITDGQKVEYEQTLFKIRRD